MIVLKDTLHRNRINGYAIVLGREEFTNPVVSKYLEEQGLDEHSILLDIHDRSVTYEDFKFKSRGAALPTPLYRVHSINAELLVAECWHITDQECKTTHEIIECPIRIVCSTPANMNEYQGFSTVDSPWVRNFMGLVINRDEEIIRDIAEEASREYRDWFKHGKER